MDLINYIYKKKKFFFLKYTKNDIKNNIYIYIICICIDIRRSVLVYLQVITPSLKASNLNMNRSIIPSNSFEATKPRFVLAPSLK